MKKTALFIIVIQIITIGLILFKIHANSETKEVLGAVSVAPLNSENLIFSADSEFKYYSTLQPSVKTDDKRFWDNTYAHYTINKDGLNERYDYDTSKFDGVFRIVTLGDSFTFGHFVDTKDNWTERLEDLLNQQSLCTKINRFEVINLGMQGFDIPYIVKRYNDIGLKYHPDLIIWFESGSGFSRDNEKMQPIIQDCQAKTTTETDTTISVDKFYKCWGDAQKQVLKNNTIEDIKKGLENWISKFLITRGSTPILFATFSGTDQSDKAIFQRRGEDQTNVFITDQISDITFKKETFPDGHPNITGHTIIAKDLFKYLTDNKSILLKCD